MKKIFIVVIILILAGTVYAENINSTRVNETLKDTLDRYGRWTKIEFSDGTEMATAGGGAGDMSAATYDPQSIAGDAFALSTHTGILPISKGGTGTNTAHLENYTLAGTITVEGNDWAFSGSATIHSNGTMTVAADNGNNLYLRANGAGRVYIDGTMAYRVVAMADGTSFTPTAATADINTHINTQAIGVLTANAPTGTATDGQKLILRIKTTNVQTYSWNGTYRFSTSNGTVTVSSGSDLTDYVGLMYNSTDAKWDVVSVSMGY